MDKKAEEIQVQNLTKFAKKFYARKFLEKCAECGITAETPDDAFELFKMASQLLAAGIAAPDQGTDLIKQASAGLDMLFAEEPAPELDVDTKKAVASVLEQL